MKKVLDSFMNENDETFVEYFERQRTTKFNKRLDFCEIYNAEKKVFEKFPRVRDIFEDDTVKEFTDEENDAITEIFKLENLRVNLEIKEAFKLGAKEAYIFFKEQDMLKS